VLDFLKNEDERIPDYVAEGEDINNKKINITFTYPRDDKYDYFVTNTIINLDEECLKDLSNGQGFIIREPQAINKTIKSEWGIFSSKFGRSLQDKKPDSHRFSCKYGCTQGAFYAVPDDANWVCPTCGTEVKKVGDDFTFFGWIKLKDNYVLIHPALLTSITSIIGKDNLDNIIEPNFELDGNGNPMSNYDKRLLKKKNARKFKKKTKVDSKYEGIGILGFRDKFDEIIKYFLKKKPAKKDEYAKIMRYRDCVFTHSIPVYTVQLRIFKEENKRLTFEKTNADFNLLASLAAKVNRDHLSVYRNRKYQNQVLWDMQTKLGSLTTEITKILSGKKGTFRTTISGRTSFTERSVIVPDPYLRMDEVSLPYFGLCLLLEQLIINIIQSSYNITYANAYKMWYYATLRKDKRVYDIIDNLCKLDKVHVIINRNPSIFYQSIVWKRVVKINEEYVMGVDPYILDGLCADFDGDTLNIKLLYNKDFDRACEATYSPRNAFCISRNDGTFNKMVSPIKDTLINLNALTHMTHKNYSPEQMQRLNAFKAKHKIK
jgi:hypothetical protein